MKAKREALRKELQELHAYLERVRDNARKEGTPEEREFRVRAGRRALDGIQRRLDELKRIGEPEPWVTAPTRQRVDQAGEAPHTTVTRTEGQPDGVVHRWLSPVETLHRRYLAAPEEVVAGSRLNAAFHKLGTQLGAIDYNSAMRASDPARRLPLAEEQEGAWGEFLYVMKRLTERERMIAWALVLQAPFPGEPEPLKAHQFVQKVWDIRGTTDARNIGYGLLMSVLDRLVGIYRRFDYERAQNNAALRDRMKQEYDAHMRRVPNSRVRLPRE